MRQDEIIRELISQNIASGIDNEKLKRYNAAASSFFKAITGICDIIIFKRTGRIPDNHTERFDALMKEWKDIYEIMRNLFRTYRDSYTRFISAEEVKRIKNGIKRIAKLGGVEKEFAESVQKL